ncbi:MAG: hypothetical protein IJS15_10605 [Victivallales bacterium]|nr:hypothetical protein [Victivallales bacterium]
MTKVLFICRSDRIAGKMAAAYLARKMAELGQTDFEATSAGTAVRHGDGIPEVAVNVLKEFGCTVQTITSNPLTLKDIRNADLIVCLTAELLRDITGGYKSARGKTVSLMSMLRDGRDVFEPRSTADACRQCLQMMMPALDRMAERLT